MFEPAGLLDGLNPEQQRAVTHPPGQPLLVLAGAGTGKTRTLVARAAWLAASGIPGSRILLLTFTRRAADDMLTRAAREARAARSEPAAAGEPGAAGAQGAAGGERICGGTFHAIAHRIIREHAEAFSLPPAFSVIDPADAAGILDVLRAGHGLTGSPRAGGGSGAGGAARRAPRAAVCADIYTRCVNTQTPVAEVVRGSFPWCEEYTSQLAELFRAYAAHKRRHGLADFDDLLLLWRAALADPSAGPVLRGMFDAVLVDEYQDVNAVQADIVRLLRPDGNGLTCVGDDAQAVYGFRGADPAHLRRLAGDFPGLSVVRLTRNYRSRQALLRLGNAIRPDSPGLELTLVADRPAGTVPLLVRCHDEATQAREICDRVLAAHEAGTELRDQAVLVRAAQHTDLLEVELSARGVPFVKYGGLKFTETAHVKDFLAAARVVINPADDIAWFRVLRLHEGIGPAHARQVAGVLRPAEAGAWDRWREAVEAAPARYRPALAATLGSLAAAAVPPAARAGTAQDGEPVTARTAAAGELAAAILAALEAPLRARYPDAPARLADLQRLADAAAARPSLHDALAELALDPPVSGSDLAGPPRLDNDFLIISTMHSAKGLEWPVVHIPQLVDGAVPSDLALAAPQGLAEERRLFYVAVTRARDQLFLYAPLRLHHHRLARDDRHGYGQLSRFLDACALAACESAEAAPPSGPVLPRTGALAARVDAELGSLWAG